MVKWAESEATKSANIYIDNVVMYKNSEVFIEKWKDDFNEDTLDLGNWGYELGSIRGWEQQHYVNSGENIFMRNGNLVIKSTNRVKED